MIAVAPKRSSTDSSASLDPNSDALVGTEGSVVTQPLSAVARAKLEQVTFNAQKLWGKLPTFTYVGCDCGGGGRVMCCIRICKRINTFLALTASSNPLVVMCGVV